MAARRSHLEVVKALLERKDLVKVTRDEDGWTPFGHAVDEGHTDIARAMIDSVEVEHGGEPVNLAQMGINQPENRTKR
ncbi:hypothetical protein N7497_003731 [Penicillium chrysogenum]|jgi:ankyrin repeat protein|uniref:Ankyrin repeat protein n=1 Tax=Penicillium chrysogenum TaxID=5076 RepID=A0ABQ8WWT3_PENCH|nr:hypothetical protein N7505_001429 [Penicillium chrysogenum]KAJ6163752.1 hypothetical protein N7497_003731 [Penicillium chrysogenum]